MQWVDDTQINASLYMYIYGCELRLRKPVWHLHLVFLCWNIVHLMQETLYIHRDHINIAMCYPNISRSQTGFYDSYLA